MGFIIKDRIIYQNKDPKEAIVQQIAYTIKSLHDYENAYALMTQNAISLEDIIQRTSKLKIEEIITLADRYILK